VANTKITELTQLTNPVSTDVLPIVDVAADVTKKISIADLLKNASAGTAAAPGIAFDGDNAGIYSPGADQVAISTNGTEKLRLTSDGKLGVGTSSPGSLLELSGSGSASELRLRSTDTTNAIIRSYVNSLEAGKIAFTSGRELFIETAGAERLRITSDGKLGLGTSSPVDRLHVDGRIAVTSDSSAPTTGEAFFYKSATGAVMSGFGASIETGGAGSRQTRLSIDSSGNVGIGTTSPSTLLHLDTLNEATAITVAAISSTGGQLRLGIGAKSSGFQSIVATGNGLDIGTTLGAPITFFTNGTVNERARIDSSGRLLVGTSSTPVSSTVVLQGRSGATTSEAILRLCRGQDTPADGALLGDLSFGDSNNGDAARIFAQRDGGTWTSASSRPSCLVFSVTADGASSPTEAMRIKNSRIINIANTPVYADNAAAKTGGLVDGDVYRTSTGDLKIVYT